MLLNFVKLRTLLIEKGSHKRYAMSAALVEVIIIIIIISSSFNVDIS